MVELVWHESEAPQATRRKQPRLSPEVLVATTRAADPTEKDKDINSLLKETD